jgi:endonuclease/exonuclease/phosphatase family metal-dependent hydrolase
VQRSIYALVGSSFEDLFSSEALPLLRAAGFSDSLEFLPTALTKLHSLALPEVCFPVDHIMVKGGDATGYERYSESLFEIASDHYPLSANVRLPDAQ